jgi:hypothetical protein
VRFDDGFNHHFGIGRHRIDHVGISSKRRLILLISRPIRKIDRIRSGPLAVAGLQTGRSYLNGHKSVYPTICSPSSKHAAAT